MNIDLNVLEVRKLLYYIDKKGMERHIELTVKQQDKLDNFLIAMSRGYGFGDDNNNKIELVEE